MQDSINQIIADNTGLIFKQIRKFNLVADPDAESLGYEALYNAIITYDDTKNIKFSTYATVCIYNALGTYVRSLNKQRQLEVISYNNVAYSEDGTNHEFAEFLESPTNLEQDILKNDLWGVVNDEFKKAYDKLTNEKHRHIIKLWHEADYEISTVVIAKAVSVSQPYVSQVINNFKFALRKRLEAYYRD